MGGGGEGGGTGGGRRRRRRRRRDPSDGGTCDTADEARNALRIRDFEILRLRVAARVKEAVRAADR